MVLALVLAGCAGHRGSAYTPGYAPVTLLSAAGAGGRPVGPYISKAAARFGMPEQWDFPRDRQHGYLRLPNRPGR